MKSLIISLILFSILLLCVIGNAFYIHHVANHIVGISESLSLDEASENSLHELDAYWDRQRKFVSLSVGFRELDHMHETLISLHSAYDMKSQVEFDCYRSLLIEAANEISRLEKFSVENLF